MNCSSIYRNQPNFITHDQARQMLGLGWNAIKLPCLMFVENAAFGPLGTTVFSKPVLVGPTADVHSLKCDYSSSQRMCILFGERGNHDRYFFKLVVNDQMETLAVSQIVVRTNDHLSLLSLNNSAEQIVKINNYETV